jgi:hypothetical protein
MKQTMIEKYGVENIFDSKEMQESIKEKQIKSLIDKYGVQNPSYVGKSQEIINIISNKEELAHHINILSKELDATPTINDLYGYLFEEISKSAICNLLRRYELQHLIDYNKKISSYEDEIYDYVKTLMNEEDIIRSSRPE